MYIKKRFGIEPIQSFKRGGKNYHEKIQRNKKKADKYSKKLEDENLSDRKRARYERKQSKANQRVASAKENAVMQGIDMLRNRGYEVVPRNEIDESAMPSNPFSGSPNIELSKAQQDLDDFKMGLMALKADMNGAALKYATENAKYAKQQPKAQTRFVAQKPQVVQQMQEAPVSNKENLVNNYNIVKGAISNMANSAKGLYNNTVGAMTAGNQATGLGDPNNAFNLDDHLYQRKAIYDMKQQNQEPVSASTPSNSGYVLAEGSNYLNPNANFATGKVQMNTGNLAPLNRSYGYNFKMPVAPDYTHSPYTYNSDPIINPLDVAFDPYLNERQAVIDGMTAKNKAKSESKKEQPKEAVSNQPKNYFNIYRRFPLNNYLK